MGAIQPFISGAISKTVNVPNEATVDDIFNTYVESWKAGVKAIAIYRDGSKAVQPLSTKNDDKSSSSPRPLGEGQGEGSEPQVVTVYQPVRKRLPDTRPSITHKFSVEGHEGYINVGLYDSGAPGEIFVTMAKEGSTISGMMDAFATSISLTLQYGVPLRDLVQKFSHMRFEPMGRTENREIPVAQSIVDYIFRWLASQFLDEEAKSELGILTEAERARLAARYDAVQTQFVIAPVSDATAAPDASLSAHAEALEASSVGAITARPEALEGRASAPMPPIAGGADLLPVTSTNGNGSGAYKGPRVQADAPTCANCGWIMSRSGTCYRCENCGSTSGCS
jgi:ribonucleoside-diphosphate reductase alpha chain